MAETMERRDIPAMVETRRPVPMTRKKRTTRTTRATRKGSVAEKEESQSARVVVGKGDEASRRAMMAGDKHGNRMEDLRVWAERVSVGGVLQRWDVFLV